MNFEQFTYSPIIQDKQSSVGAGVQDIKFSIVPQSSYLEDNRTLMEFKKHTFGNHLKTDAMKFFEQSCMKAEIEKACYWAFQLLASGAINQVWERCYAIIYKQINIQNPNSCEWVLNKEKLFRKIVSKKEFSKDAILYTRNIQQIRNILTEMIAFLCLSNKRKLDTLSFKFTDREFDIQVFNTKTPNKHNIVIKPVLGPNDSREVIMAANELYFAIKNKNIQDIIYWLTWIYNWEKINIKKYKLFQVQARSIEGIANEHQRDVSWLIWSVIQFASTNIFGETDSNKEKQLKSLWLLYIFNWKPGCKTKKLPLMIWYCSLLISPFTDYSTPVISNMKVYIKVISNVNLMFQKIKQQERGGVTKSQSLLGANINLVIENNLSSATNNNSLINMVHNDKESSKSSRQKKSSGGNSRGGGGNSRGGLDNKTQSKLDIMMKLDGYL
jgi:hypothetical protein